MENVKVTASAGNRTILEFERISLSPLCYKQLIIPEIWSRFRLRTSFRISRSREQEKQGCCSVLNYNLYDRIHVLFRHPTTNKLKSKRNDWLSMSYPNFCGLIMLIVCRISLSATTIEDTAHVELQTKQGIIHGRKTEHSNEYLG